MSEPEPIAQSLPPLLIALASELVHAIDTGVRDRGFTDLRPAHGFAFARLAPGGATVNELAVHLGVTKQAASQMVDDLVRKGYVERHPHPSDARAKLIVLTDLGWECTRATEAAAADAVRPWATTLGRRRLRELHEDLNLLAPVGQLRPAW
ncbi:MarR family winged helix-turn-helix transcriptional regulator [Kitasatospora sp. NPDC051853]|uniref:MarR family winged helix-turn-helix transcriptional regulator n=1 Tax=Kitasatospora sp. NPDC051853 TaxID=3364058 RepID=UPI0037BD55D6